MRELIRGVVLPQGLSGSRLGLQSSESLTRVEDVSQETFVPQSWASEVLEPRPSTAANFSHREQGGNLVFCELVSELVHRYVFVLCIKIQLLSPVHIPVEGA